MCFHLMNENVKGDNPLIADRDIICYKEVNLSVTRDGNLSILSEVQNYKYTIGKLVKANFEIYIWEIYSGLHSYNTMGGNCNVKCIIPKGATYYKNRTQYCSNQIKIIALTRAGKQQVKAEVNRRLRVIKSNLIRHKASLEKLPKLIKVEEEKLIKVIIFKEKVQNNILKLR